MFHRGGAGTLAKIRGGRPFLFNRSHIGCLGGGCVCFLDVSQIQHWLRFLEHFVFGLPSFCVPFQRASSFHFTMMPNFSKYKEHLEMANLDSTLEIIDRRQIPL